MKRTVDFEFNPETGDILDISDKGLELVILETTEEGNIRKVLPKVPLIQELATVIQKLSVENALARLDSDTSRQGWKRLQGTLEEHVRADRTTAYTTETIQKGFLQKNAKWVIILAILIGCLFIYYYMGMKEPGPLDLGE